MFFIITEKKAKQNEPETAYRMTLDNGTYSVALGFCDPWWDSGRSSYILVNNEQLATVDVKSTPSVVNLTDINVDNGEIEVLLKATGDDDPIISFVYVYKTPDTKSPVTVDISPEASDKWYNLPVTAQLQVECEAPIEMVAYKRTQIPMENNFIDDGSWTLFSDEDINSNIYNITISDQGDNYVHWYAVSKNGQNTQGCSGNYMIDTAAPIIESFATRPLSADTIRLDVTADDEGSGISEYHWMIQLDNNEWTPLSSTKESSWTAINLQPGTLYGFKVIVTDSAGNEASEVQWEPTLSEQDASCGYLKVLSPEENKWYNSDITVEMQVVKEDEDSVIEMVYYKITQNSVEADFIDDGSWSSFLEIENTEFQNVTSGGSLSLNVEGNNYIHWYSANSDTSVQGKAGAFGIDKTDPEITDFTASLQADNTVNLAITASDAGGSGIHLYRWMMKSPMGSWDLLAETESSVYTYTVSGLEPATGYSFYVEILDNAGNKSNSSILDVTTASKESTEFTVTYNGNGATGGTAPTDNNTYTTGQNVIVADRGTLSKSGYTFRGWSLNGKLYSSGDAFIMGEEDVVLYASWRSNSSSEDSSSDSDNSSDSPSKNSDSNDSKFIVANKTTEAQVESEINKLLKDNSNLILNLGNNTDKVAMNKKTVDSILAAGVPLTVCKDETELTIPSSELPELKNKSTLMVKINPLEAGEKDNILNTIINLEVFIDNAPVTEFSSPLEVTIDLSSDKLTTQQKKLLSGARFTENGIDKLGGSYDDKTKKLKFYTSKLSNYGVIIADDLVHLSLSVNDQHYTKNGTSLLFDTAPVIVDDSALVPVRLIAESFGADIAWDEQTKTVDIELDGKILSLTIGDKLAGMNTPAMIINDRTMIPIKYVSEYFDANVIYDDISKTIAVYR